MRVRFYDGGMFPTQAEKDRSRKIEDFYSLYRGNFGLVLRYFRSQREKENQLEVVQNVAGMLSRIFADLMFTEDVKVRVTDKGLQERIDEFLMRNNAQNKFHESALTQSYAGKTYFEMYLKDGLAHFYELNPANVYPQYDSMFAYGEPRSIVISWECTIGGEPYRFIKTHSVGLITNELRKIKKGSGEDLGSANLSILDPNLLEIEETDLDYIPVYTVNNVKSGREVEGLSDYDDLFSLFEELTRVQSQIATQLKKHADAKMAVPPGVLDEHGRVRVEATEMFEVASGSEDGMVVPQYITNANPMIDQAFKESEKLLEAIARVAEVSTILMDWNVSGGAERVGALRLRLLRTMSKVKRKIRPYGNVIRDMVVDAMKWEGIAPNLTMKDVNVEFGDGLPVDMLEQTQIEVMRYNGRLQTLPDAIRNLDDIEGDTLEKKVAAIDAEKEAEKEAAMNSVPSFSFGA